jgi:hypothetical protein
MTPDIVHGRDGSDIYYVDDGGDVAACLIREADPTAGLRLALTSAS